MADKVKLSVDLEPELRRRVKLAATSRDQTVRQWIATAIRHELEREIEESLIPGQERTSEPGLKHPPKARSGRPVSDAVLEERRAGW